MPHLFTALTPQFPRIYSGVFFKGWEFSFSFMSYLLKPKVMCLLFATLAASMSTANGLAVFIDPLDAAAVASDRVAASLLVAVTRTPGESEPGSHWVAVGRRGHVILSHDGKAWQQAASVPVSTDLVSVFFVNARNGWAVGHGGVIIATTDGGKHWVKQLDGRQVADALVKFYEPLATGSKDSGIAFGLRDAIRLKENGPGRPFLDVWFGDEKRGYAIGAYNLLFVTEDGGNTWQPRPDRLINEMALHLNAIAAVGNNVYIAGEQGLFARRNPKTGNFDRIKTPYSGNFFGLTGKEGLLVLFGLQGNAFRSWDNGASWEKIEPGLKNTITSGTMLADGRLVLASQGGAFAVSADNGDHFTRIMSAAPAPIYAIAPGSGNSIVAVGNRGVKTESLKQGMQHGG